MSKEQNSKEVRKPEFISGFTRMYLHEYTTPWGEHKKEIAHGDICDDIKDLPGYKEYCIADYKYLGVSKITIEPMFNSKGEPIQ